jgi:hypothetical protein
MTSAILNPANPGAYSVEDVPKSGSDRSRYALDRLPEGHPSRSCAETIAQSYERLLTLRKEQAAALVPERKRIPLKWIGRDPESGEWTIRERGVVDAAPSVAGTAPSRFAKLRSSGGALVDELLLGPDGGEAWSKARDEDVWEALRDLCEAEFPDGLTARRLNDAVCAAILLRHGIDVRPDRLPQEHLKAALNGRTEE